MYTIENKIEIIRELNKYKVIVKCSNCGEEVETHKCRIKERKNMFCSLTCKYEFESKYRKWSKEHKQYLKDINLGELNSNFGNKWNEEQRRHQGDIMNKRFLDPVERWKAGKANRGKWKEKDDYDVYARMSNWVHKMFDIVPDGIELLTEYGVYNVKTNLDGVSRDHRYSIREGFGSGIFPELLRHPINCEVMQFKLNASKNWKCSVTKEQLFKDILSYTDEWFEQDLCVELIESYKNGKRYNKEEYIKRYE